MDLELSLPAEINSGLGHPLILVADDNEDNLLLLVHTLNIFGFSHISTVKGQAVFNLAQNYQPDLILLDVIFPDVSGIEVIKRLKNDPQTKSIPIIAVTALARQEDRNQLLQLGCQDYLDKPYDLDKLELMLHFHLNRTASAF
jgi:CheY-like chemotaxis protein